MKQSLKCREKGLAVWLPIAQAQRHSPACASPWRHFHPTLPMSNGNLCFKKK